MVDAISKPPVLDAVAVSKTYQGSPPVHALRTVSVRVRAGEHVAVMGRSGSGKSTLLNLLGLLDRPSSGEIRLDGVNTGGLGDRDRTAMRAGRVAFVFQAFHLLDYRSAVENVEVGLLHAGVSRSERREIALDALRAVGLIHRAHASPATLSGGEKQRVALARAVAPQPRVLLSDEPTGNLDSASADTVLSILNSLNKTGVALITVTHDAHVAGAADVIVELVDGSVAESRSVR